MSFPKNTDSTPSIQDSFGANGATGLPDEQFIQDLDGHPYWEPTDEDLEQMYAEWCARLAREEAEARSTSVRIAQGNIAAVDAVIALFSEDRRAS